MLYAFPPKSREITDYRLEDGILYLYSQALKHRIIPISEDIARISCTDAEYFYSGDKPGVILKSVSDGWKLSADSDTLNFSSAALSIVIDRKTASYSYFDGEGRMLLCEKNRASKELDGFTAYKREASTKESVKTADGEKTVVTDGRKIEWGRLYHTRLNLTFADGEALYGLGQHEEGFMNLRGKTVYVYQANRKIAVPMLEKAGLPFEKIYANDQPDLAKSFGVMQAPTLVVSDGKEYKKYTGVSEIKNYVNSIK